jgi:hypothetical protein
MPDTTPGDPPQSASDAASLTGLLCDYGALWEITRTPQGVTAQRRAHPAPPAILTAATVPALRELLENGYDTAALADLTRGFGAGWQIKRLDPDSAWVAVSRDHDPVRVVAAGDLDSLRSRISDAQDGTPTDGTSPLVPRPGAVGTSGHP